MPSSIVNDNANITMFSSFTKNILNSHKSITTIGIVDQNCYLLGDTKN